jgi:hypothetical protein
MLAVNVFAEPPPPYVHDPGLLVDVKSVRADNGGVVELYLYLIPTPEGGTAIVAKLLDGTIVFFDPFPADKTQPILIDQAFCAKPGGAFRTGVKASGDFIDWATCPRVGVL